MRDTFGANLPFGHRRRGRYTEESVNRPRRLSMNGPLSLPSPPPAARERVAEGREKGGGSWSQCMRSSARRLSMSRPAPDSSQQAGSQGHER